MQAKRKCTSSRCSGRSWGKEKKRLAAALRNETRKRQRVLKKSMHLTNADLVEVLTMRKCKEEKTLSESQAKDAGEFVEPKKRSPKGCFAKSHSAPP